MPDPLIKQSKVLTLVFTDLADSTALKTLHGDQAGDDLIARHRAIVEQLSAECRGRIVDWAGDGCFLTFDTSSAAVLFALRIQQTHDQERNLPGVRVGIHIGEVTDSLSHTGAVRVAGLAVDIASRICGLARPGQLLMSAPVYDSAHQRIGADALGQPILWRSHGVYAIKGVDKDIEIAEAGIEGVAPFTLPPTGDKARLVRRTRPGSTRTHGKSRRVFVPGWGLLVLLFVGGAGYLYFTKTQNAPGSDDALRVRSLVDPPIRSLAVLPLDNLSGDPKQEYFADGMTEAITSELAKIKALKVVSRTSVMRFKHSELPMPEIGEELGVEGVIDGSVQRDGDQIKIIVHLIHAPTDTHRWTNDYTDTITSVLVLQSEVALAIADALQAELTGEERARVARADSVNKDAYNEYLLGLHSRELGTREGILASVQHFERATTLDPQFAEAWGRLGQAYCLIAGSGAVAPGDLFPRARAAALKALQLDGDLPSAHNALGMCALFYDWEWEQADAHLRRSVEVDPNGVFGNLFLALFLSWMGRDQEGVSYVTKALERGSADPWVVTTASQLLLSARDFADARAYLERALEARPDFTPLMLPLAIAYEATGNRDEAAQLMAKALEMDGRSIASLLRAATIAATREDKTEAESLLAEALTARGYIEPGYVYPVYVRLGNFDEAFAWIEKGIDAKSPGVVSLRTLPYSTVYANAPNFIRFRTDPRYRAILDRLKFPPLPEEHPGYADEQAWLSRSAQTTP